MMYVLEFELPLHLAHQAELCSRTPQQAYAQSPLVVPRGCVGFGASSKR